MRLTFGLFVMMSAVGCKTTWPALPEADGPDRVWLFGQEVPSETGSIRTTVEKQIPANRPQKATVEALASEGFRVDGQLPKGGMKLSSQRLMTNRWGVCQKVMIELSAPDAAKHVSIADVQIGDYDFGAKGVLLATKPAVRQIVGLPTDEARHVLHSNGFRVWPVEVGPTGRSHFLARYCEETGLGAEIVRLTVGIGADGRVTDLALPESTGYDIALGILPARDVPIIEQPGAYLFFPFRAVTIATAAMFSGAYAR